MTTFASMMFASMLCFKKGRKSTENSADNERKKVSIIPPTLTEKEIRSVCCHELSGKLYKDRGQPLLWWTYASYIFPSTEQKQAISALISLSQTNSLDL